MCSVLCKLCYSSTKHTVGTNTVLPIITTGQQVCFMEIFKMTLFTFHIGTKMKAFQCFHKNRTGYKVSRSGHVCLYPPSFYILRTRALIWGAKDPAWHLSSVCYRPVIHPKSLWFSQVRNLSQTTDALHWPRTSCLPARCPVWLYLPEITGLKAQLVT